MVIDTLMKVKMVGEFKRLANQLAHGLTRTVPSVQRTKFKGNSQRTLGDSSLRATCGKVDRIPCRTGSVNLFHLSWEEASTH